MSRKLGHALVGSTVTALLFLGVHTASVHGESGRSPRDEERTELARRAEAIEPFMHAFRRVAAFARPSVVLVEAKNDLGIAMTSEEQPDDELPDEKLRTFFMSPLRFEGEGSATRWVSSGSGVIVDASGTVLTNAHVAATRVAPRKAAAEIRVELGGARWFQATVVGWDTQSDLAVLKIVDPPHDLEPAVLADSEQVGCGDWVVAIGATSSGGQTTSVGVVAAKGTSAPAPRLEDFMQTDAAINPVNTGGPLLDLRGEVVGINVASPFRTGGSLGVGFAIPSNTARSVQRKIEADRVAAKTR